MNHLCRSYSVLPATHQPFHSPPTAPDAPLPSQLISTLIKGFPCIQESLHYFTPRGTGPILLPVLFFFTSSLFHPTQLCRNLSCPFWCPRSSASVQLVLCENCSICICIFLIHIFLIHLRREMTSRSSYYPAILLFIMLLFHSSLTILLSLATISAIFSYKPWDL